MKILSLESSCDETAAAVIENGQRILSSVVASSVAKHRQTGGIIPEIAAREQLHYMVPVVEQALDEAGQLAPSAIEAIAVTVGPGLIGSLLVGVETAKALSFVWQKPIIPVNHLIGHLYANWLTFPDSPPQPLPQFPLIALVVSGGHSDLVLMKEHGQIQWLGGTRDDAAGECFDKTARLLGLGYPGGPAIAAAAASASTINHQPSTIKLPRPMINGDNFDFSFSGLKTAVLREVNSLKNNQQYTDLTIQQLAFEVQEAITDVLIAKTLKAVQQYEVKTLLLAGGVSANQRLRGKMQIAINKLNLEINLHLPPPQLCTDNAAGIAAAAFYNYKPAPWSQIGVLPGLTITGEI